MSHSQKKVLVLSVHTKEYEKLCVKRGKNCDIKKLKLKAQKKEEENDISETIWGIFLEHAIPTLFMI